MKTFEDYLKEGHAKNYRGLDDEMPDAYEGWVAELDIETVIQLAEEYGKDLHDKFIEDYGDFKGNSGRTVRFYELPHTEHKPGDDGNI